MVYFDLDQILRTYAGQHCQTNGMRNIIFYGRGFADHQSGWSWSASENAHEPRGMDGSNVAYLFILILSGPCMQNGDEASPSIISAGRGILVKMFITLETHGIF